MNKQSTLQSSQAVAKELDISPASLRRWSDEFIDYLSSEADFNKGRGHRRYTKRDITTLLLIKELMSDGMTYEQVRHELKERSVVSVENPIIEQLEDNGEADLEEDNSDKDDMALVATANGSESPAIAFLTNTLATLSDSQKSILNSQAANRELLGVLLQDNFNLKEENNRLRERILEIERDLARSRQEEEWRREALRQELEAKITAANQLATEAITVARTAEMTAPPEIRAVETRPGCLGMLLGRGATQIITIPRRRKPDEREGTPVSKYPPTGSSQQHPVSPPPPHPKPLFPPE
jgi:DNA-binding transcriptional MerR regulator